MSDVTYFDTAKRSFKDVPVINEEIALTEFLEAAESVVALFGMASTLSLSPSLIEISELTAGHRPAGLNRLPGRPEGHDREHQGTESDDRREAGMPVT